MKVEYSGVRSAPVPFPIVAATPGIFQLDDSDGVAKWVFNQDGSLNSPANPAPSGSIIVFYATAGGETNPASVDGSPAVPPLAEPTQSTSVTIGGVDASILYAGAAPNLIAGLLQINVRVPQGLGASATAPLVFTVGGVPSQSGCSVAVR